MQGDETIFAPTDSLLPAGKVEVFTVKMHEPKVRSPVAVDVPSVMVKAGGGVPIGAATTFRVVEPVVPRSGTPLANTIDEVVIACTAFEPLVASTVTGGVLAATLMGPSLLPPPPPPQATRSAVADVTTANFQRLLIKPLPQLLVDAAVEGTRRVSKRKQEYGRQLVLIAVTVPCR